MKSNPRRHNPFTSGRARTPYASPPCPLTPPHRPCAKRPRVSALGSRHVSRDFRNVVRPPHTGQSATFLPSRRASDRAQALSSMEPGTAKTIFVVLHRHNDNRSIEPDLRNGFRDPKRFPNEYADDGTAEFTNAVYNYTDKQ